MASEDLPDRLVIGVDFGTTFSGVAEAYSERAPLADEIQIIRQWPGAHGVTSEKVPSELAYGNSVTAQPSFRPPYGAHISSRSNSTRSSSILGLSGFSELRTALNEDLIDDPSSIRWGFEVRQNERRLRCMKLLLDPQQSVPGYISGTDVKEELKRVKKQAEDAVADYLTKLFKHTEEVLLRRYGQTFMSTTRLDVVLTVPAVWSDAAKDATLRAAEKAASSVGLPLSDHLSLISEPEAAAVYTLQAIHPRILKEQDSFIVCDAGGGTVDLISYQIEQISPLRIKESTEGTGKCCGAALLNMRFEQFVRSRLGESAFMDLYQRDSRSWLEALKCFEQYVKRNYSPNDDTDYSIPLPGVADNAKASVEAGYLTMTSEQAGELFRPIIEDIIGLIKGQIGKLESKGKQVTGILLVGGFGQNECLYQALQKQFGGYITSPPPYSRTAPVGEVARPGIQVLQPPNAWTAVVRGAVLRGLEGAEFVLSRKARYNYGIICHQRFDPAVHPASCKYWCDLEECYRAGERMTWYIKKAQTLSSSDPILFPFYRNFGKGASRATTEILVFNKDDVAPAGYDGGHNSITPVLCTLDVDLSAVPNVYFIPKVNSQQRTYERLDFYIGMHVESGNITFDVRVGGVVYGKAAVKFE